MKEETKNEKSERAKREEEILDFWTKNNIFQKSLDKDSPKGEFIMYDGPPFATGLPHYGHILPGTMKDVIPRYKTMQGYHVPRKWGWDCHGLPIENLIEKEIGLSTKKEIVEYGIEKFNQAARDSVLRYEKEWKKIIPRTGRWADMDNAYLSMDSKYTESVWWVFSELEKKGLIYKSYKSMHLCPRCETTLANFEVNQGYVDVKDISVTVKLTLKETPDTHILIWTTTPWTMPGNIAAAVNSNIVYAEVSHDGEKYILAKDRVSEIFKDKEHEIIRDIKGADLVGVEYIPPFEYYLDKEIDNKNNAWKVYHADYVTIEDGTGIVHLAPAYGAEDLEIAKAENIPQIQHVGRDGKFKDEVVDFAGMLIKKKDDTMSADVEIVKALAARGKLFEKEKITHSYPHCWRCQTPLLNFATNSWFVDVPKIKEKLIANNEKINWVPGHIKEGRFGKWLEGAREWALSRSRFWGAPLPVWTSDDEKEILIINSVDSLKKHTKKSGNTYHVMRHGESESNVKQILTTNINTPDHVTENGKKQVEMASEKLSSMNIDLVFVSPFIRTQETLNILNKKLGLDSSAIITDERITEINVGHFDEQEYSVHHTHSDEKSDFKMKPKDGESLDDVRIRMGEFLYDVEAKYSNKNVLIISHGTPIWMLEIVASGLNEEKGLEISRFKNAEIRKIDFIPLPHNELYELDLHRPYIDEIEIEKDGQKMKRIEDVFDVWFDSGSMPYAQLHYPFENKELLEKERFPADYIAEGMDQTRGWFYVLMVLSTALFDKPAFKNVIVSGMVLAEDGKKMSKSLNNSPDLSLVLDSSGADAFRLFLMSSPLIRGEEVNLSLKNIHEVHNKVIGRLQNILEFYKMYAKKSGGPEKVKSSNVLDQWIISRANQLNEEMTNGLDSYEIDKAARPIFDFVDDLSTWYIRRSRNRFKGEGDDRVNAEATTQYILNLTSKLVAPIMPFIAEDIYKETNGELESVHLESWPGKEKIDLSILDIMKKTREIISSALLLRSEANIKVRQPLSSLTITEKLDEDYLELIRDEVNVKEIMLGDELKLDINITAELKEEGNVREIIRYIQTLRKDKGLMPEDQIEVMIKTNDTGKDTISKFIENIKSTVGAKNITFKDEITGEELTVDDTSYVIEIK